MPERFTGSIRQESRQLAPFLELLREGRTMVRQFASLRARRGAWLPLVIVSFTVLIGFVAFAVDLGYISMVKNELRAAVDAASLAGASGLPVGPAEARRRAIEIGEQNVVNGKPIELRDSDIELGIWNATTKQFSPLVGSNESTATAVRITARLTSERGTQVNLIFAPLLGHKTAQMKITAVAGFSYGADLVLVQDITLSFADELEDAKAGDQALLADLYAGGNGLSYVGIVAHTGWGKTMAALQPVNSNYASLSGVITSLKHCGNPGMPVCSGTDPAAGIEEAVKVFNDSSFVSRGGAKVIVLVSDGEPTNSSNGSHPTLNATQLFTLAQQKADDAWAQKIHLYVVFFNRDKSQAAADRLRTLIRGRGDFVEVIDADDLPAALRAITKKLPTQIVQ
jgi:Flp pilus assembly protein TadG